MFSFSAQYFSEQSGSIETVVNKEFSEGVFLSFFIALAIALSFYLAPHIVLFFKKIFLLTINFFNHSKKQIIRKTQ